MKKFRQYKNLYEKYKTISMKQLTKTECILQGLSSWNLLRLFQIKNKAFTAVSSMK